MEEHEAGHVELARAVGQHPLDALPLGELLAEGLAGRHVLDREVEGPLGQGHIVHAVPQAAVGETMLAHIEAIALAAQQVLSRDHQILDVDLGVSAAHDVRERAFQCHGRDVALDDVTGVWQLDDEGGVALVARGLRIRHGHDQGEVSGAGGGGEPLLTVQDVVALAVLHRPGLHARGVGTCSLLRHGVADALLAVQEGLEVLLLLKVGAVSQKGQHGGVVRPLAVHGQGTQVALAQLHLDQGVGQGTQAHAAMLLGDEGGPQALGPRLGAQFSKHQLEGLPVQEPLLSRDALLVHPAPDPLAHGLCVFRNFEIDRHGFLPCVLNSTVMSDASRDKAPRRIRPDRPGRCSARYPRRARSSRLQTPLTPGA